MIANVPYVETYTSTTPNFIETNISNCEFTDTGMLITFADGTGYYIEF